MTAWKSRLSPPDRWVLDHLAQPGVVGVSALDAPFHDAYAAKWGGVRDLRAVGASPVHAAMAALTRLFRQGFAERRRVTLDVAWQPGFPRWVYGYTITDEGRAELAKIREG